MEVTSDPLNDVENDPYEDGSDAQRQIRGHQVSYWMLSMMVVKWCKQAEMEALEKA